VLTRPLGASLGDLLSQARTYGGLGFGTIGTSAAFLVIIIALVTFLSLGGTDLQMGRSGPKRTEPADLD
jgi:uncharacterized membrane-anchored protein